MFNIKATGRYLKVYCLTKVPLPQHILHPKALKATLTWLKAQLYWTTTSLEHFNDSCQTLSSFKDQPDNKPPGVTRTRGQRSRNTDNILRWPVNDHRWLRSSEKKIRVSASLCGTMVHSGSQQTHCGHVYICLTEQTLTIHPSTRGLLWFSMKPPASSPYTALYQSVLHTTTYIRSILTWNSPMWIYSSVVALKDRCCFWVCVVLLDTALVKGSVNHCARPHWEIELEKGGDAYPLSLTHSPLTDNPSWKTITFPGLVSKIK